MKPLHLLTLAASLGWSLLSAAPLLADDATPSTSTNQAPINETPAQRDARLAWFREARFGMFIHWGLYAEAAGYWNGKPTAGAGEWIMNDLQIPLSQYAQLEPKFDPEQFNADDWVKAAKNAGMKYIVITSKHHEGFAMWPSRLTDWSIASTPFKRDPLKELAAACARHGVKFCFYYSIMDWHSPLYAPRKPWNDIATNPPDFDAYVAYMKGQLKELLTGYGPLGILWFDGSWENTWNWQRGQDLYRYVRSLQPRIIVNNRVGPATSWEEWSKDPAKFGGDYDTPEQSIPGNAFGSNLPWETCMTMNDTWGYKRNDEDWKSTETLVRNLIDCASKGGNYLLNVGPSPEGLIPQASLERLGQIGAWMKVNGDAIYGTTSSPFPKRLPWGRCTAKVSGDTTTLYLHVFNWPADGELLVPGLKNHVSSARLLAGGRKLPAHNLADAVAITVPAAAPDPISSTVVLRFHGAPQVEAVPIGQHRDGRITLPASDAALHGDTLKYESGGPRDNIGYWLNPADWVDWEFAVRQPGKFAVSAVIAAPAATSFEVSLDGQVLHGSAPLTGDYTVFKSVDLGTVEITRAGRSTLAVHPVKDGWQPMNLKSITLKPAPAGP